MSRLPIPAMALVTFAKTILLPIFGILIVMAMVRGGLIDHSAKVEKFVAMLLSGTPSGPKYVCSALELFNYDSHTGRPAS